MRHRKCVAVFSVRATDKTTICLYFIALKHTFGETHALTHDPAFIKRLPCVWYAHDGLAMVSKLLTHCVAEVQMRLR
ncbi:hypothetical protein VE26_04635 [Devosia chinhatensis]|uniref:Uncharacterized protein n=1 Tax=Devosia chinhatensis TaxID=429727 RepID=A0A0F5FM44_9HYPH|nr:hypothetical protein VE26_04635 [Devosia chinhatensis]